MSAAHFRAASHHRFVRVRVGVNLFRWHKRNGLRPLSPYPGVAYHPTDELLRSVEAARARGDDFARLDTWVRIAPSPPWPRALDRR